MRALWCWHLGVWEEWVLFREDYEFGFGQVGVEVAVEMRTHVSRVDLDRLWEAPCVCRHQLTSTMVQGAVTQL